MRALFATSVNLRPDPARNERRNELRVEIHGQANPIPNATLEARGTELNATEICYPCTTLRLVYRPIRSSVFPQVGMSESLRRISPGVMAGFIGEFSSTDFADLRRLKVFKIFARDWERQRPRWPRRAWLPRRTSAIRRWTMANLRRVRTSRL